MTRKEPRTATVYVFCAALALVAVTSRCAWAVEQAVTIGAPPTWVTAEPAVVKEPAASGGLSLVLLDMQTRYEKGERTRFVRGVLRVVDELGVGAAGRRTFEFVPPFEKLVLHKLELRRGKERLSQLGPERVRVLDEEPGHDASSYTGVRTAVVEMADVRVGDAVEYEYSLVGANPLLEGHVVDRWRFGLPSGAGLIRGRALSDHPLFMSPVGGAEPPTSARVGALYEYGASATQLSPVVLDTNLPAGYEPFPALALSDFESWGDVARWGAGLFVAPATHAIIFDELVGRLRGKNELPAQRALDVLRFVQDTIQDAPLSFAESTRPPTEPDIVLSRKVGDSRDKSLLMVSLLRALAVESDVALVSTTHGKSLLSTSPGAGVFDRAIVTVLIDGQRYWLDPTRLYQRGTLADVTARGLAYALILGVGQTQLTRVDEPPRTRAEIFTTLEYDIEELGGAASVSVSDQFGGRVAEALRALRASSSTEEFEDRFAAPVMRACANAERTGDTSFYDDEAKNLIHVGQHFGLEHCWGNSPEGPRMSIPPLWLRDELPRAAPDRRGPLALDYPVTLRQTSTLKVALGLRMKDFTLELSPGPFSFKATRRSDGELSKVHFEYESKTASVEPSELAAYRKAIDEMTPAVTFAIHQGMARGGRARLPRRAVLALMGAGALGALGLLGALLVRRRRPRARR